MRRGSQLFACFCSASVNGDGYLGTMATVAARSSIAAVSRRSAPLLPRVASLSSTTGPLPGAAILLATTDEMPGRRIKEYKGLAIGSTVRTKDMTKDITSAVRAMFGGELPHYTQLMADTREEAIARLQDHAASLGANGVVGLRLTSSNIAQSASEVMAYGTAVVLEE
eukprot:TRINITY_DN48371_c0_g1_i1.p1 TRINITY_DN48371_c0_g1~~TRINITY_DN48371_c0_g1_i1.p1  ORF type:complete len:168 (-),score=18.26 TRINITY_DN48371_c0_g1_i1:62-565(-)